MPEAPPPGQSLCVRPLAAQSLHPGHLPSACWRGIARECWTEYHEMLLHYADGCLRRIREAGGYVPVEAADLVQSAFLTLLEGRLATAGDIDRLPAPGNLAERLRAAISEQCQRNSRRERRHAYLRVRSGRRVVVAADAIERARSVLLADDVNRAVAALPPERRKAVEDVVIAGQPVRLVAEVEGKAEQTVRNNVARAKPVLSAALRSYRSPPRVGERCWLHRDA